SFFASRFFSGQYFNENDHVKANKKREKAFFFITIVKDGCFYY
ncbi:unnamed protein product, partial [marine sediment metagenome]